MDSIALIIYMNLREKCSYLVSQCMNMVHFPIYLGLWFLSNICFSERAFHIFY